MGFKTLNIRKQRTTISERQERNELCPTIGESLGHITGKGPSRVQQAPWLRKGAKSLGRPRQPEFLGQKTREKTAPRELWTSAQCMCVRKLPKAGKESSRIRGDGTHTEPGTVPVPRSQPGSNQLLCFLGGTEGNSLSSLPP